MFKIDTVKPEHATGDTKKAYDLFPPHVGVPLPARLYSASPALLASQIGLMKSLLANERMEYPLLTAIRYMAAVEYDHQYCKDFNADLLIRGGLTEENLAALTTDLEGLPCQEHEWPMLRLVQKVIKAPDTVTAQDIEACREAGWRDSDILELSALAGSIQVSGRLMAAFVE